VAAFGVLAVERERQHDPAESAREIRLVLPFDGVEVARQRLDDHGRQHGRPVLLAFAAPNHNLPPFPIEVFHAQLQAFLQPQSGAHTRA